MSAAHLGPLLREIWRLNPRSEGAALPADLSVTGIAYDHRQVVPGAIFVCLRGQALDGHDFAAAAVAAGARIVVGERAELPSGSGPVPYIRVDDARRALALLACAFHGHPSRHLALTGVTGTNGKTSFTHLLHAIHREARIPSAIFGTLGSGTPTPGATPSVPWRGGVHTTPESPDLQAELDRWRAAGIRAGALEVSSHGLALRRSHGTRFACVVFTNLTEDHLDFHGTMEAYGEAKALLFRRAERGPEEPPAVAVVNGDDPAADTILRGSEDRVWRFGRGPDVEVRLAELQAGPAGMRLTVVHPGGECRIDSPLLGMFQADNVLAAFAAALAVGIDSGVAAQGLGHVKGVPGRMERIDRGQGFGVLVDYAHTPDALRRSLAGLRPFTPGRVMVVFGCGGDRDRAKRPLMGAAAADGADLVFLTDDNPRREDPAAIRASVRSGIEARGGRWREIGDRAEAIQAALAEARPGDTVLIAGKGHETVQLRGDEAIPFDDREVAARLLGAKRFSLLEEQP